MKKILAINTGTRKFSDEFVSACKRLEVECDLVRAANCCIVLDDNAPTLYNKGAEVDLAKIGYSFVRVRGNYPLMISLITKLLKARKVSYNDAPNDDHTESDEKITQMILLALAKIPIPKTILFTLKGFSSNRDFILSKTIFPCVLKTNGSKGRNVWKINNVDELELKISNIDAKHEVAMVQEFIPNTFDIRAIYLFEDYLGAIKRTSVDGFYNNVSKGGSVEVIELTDEEKNISTKASKILGRDFGGVDIVRSDRGPLILEINMGPQVYGFEAATGIDVPNEIVLRIKNSFLSEK